MIPFVLRGVNEKQMYSLYRRFRQRPHFGGGFRFQRVLRQCLRTRQRRLSDNGADLRQHRRSHAQDSDAQPQKQRHGQRVRRHFAADGHGDFRFAGGFDKMADRMSVTVTYPNNQSDGTKRFLGFRRTPVVNPGGVITLRMDNEKREREEKPKEKIDWGVEARNSLSALTSVVSIILLLDRLK